MKNTSVLQVLLATLGIAIGGSALVYGAATGYSMLYGNQCSGYGCTNPLTTVAGTLAAGDAGVNILNSPVPTQLGQVPRITSLNPLAAQWQTLDAGAQVQLSNDIPPVGTFGGSGSAGTSTYAMRGNAIAPLPALPIASTVDAGVISIGSGAQQACSGATCASLQPALPACTEGQIWESSSGLTVCETPPWQLALASCSDGQIWDSVAHVPTCMTPTWQAALPVCSDGQIWDSVSGTPTCMTPAWTNTPLSNNAPPLVAAGPSVAGSSTSAARSDGQPGLSATPPNYNDFLRASGIVSTKLWTATNTGSVTSTASSAFAYERRKRYAFH